MALASLHWDSEKDVLDVKVGDIKSEKSDNLMKDAADKNGNVEDKVADNVIITKNKKGEVLHIKILNMMRDM